MKREDIEMRRAAEQAGAEQNERELFSIPDEASCSAEFPQGCIFGE